MLANVASTWILVTIAFVVVVVTSTANAMPNDMGTFASPLDFSNGVSSKAIAVEERAAADNYVYAIIRAESVPSDGETMPKEEQIAKYGEGKILNVTGKLIHVSNGDNASNHTGCSEPLLDSALNPLPKTRSWIALIERGDCHFDVKVGIAYNNSAIGVIIYNDKVSSTLDKMIIKNQERNITAVFTYNWKGKELIDLLERSESVEVTITEGGKSPRPVPNINRTSVLFVSISFIVLMIISLVWLIFYYVQRFRYLQTKDKQSRRLCNVAKRIIAKIPTKSIKSEDNEMDNDCCPICIDLYKVMDLIRVLPCNHEFHKACIDPWLLEHRTCPMCKMDILKHYGFVFTGSQESILQLDLDLEEGEILDDNEDNNRRHSVSPLPQIRSNDNHSTNLSIDSDSEDSSSPNEETPTLSHWQPATTTIKLKNNTEICVGCLAVALNKKARSNEHNHPESIDDDKERNKKSTTVTSTTTSTSTTITTRTTTNFEYHGSISLPSTLKRYTQHRHSTGSCHGGGGCINNKLTANSHVDHYHPSQNIGRVYHYTNKTRPPLKMTVVSQANSDQCDKIVSRNKIDVDVTNTENSNHNESNEKSNSEQNLLEPM